MPELPEVETIARGVDARLRGDWIEDAWFSRHTEPMATPPARQAKGLIGRRIASVARVGKHIVCTLDTGPGTASAAQWIVHLGMTGRLLVTTPEAELAAHTHARLGLRSGREMRFVDPRRFGRLEFRELGLREIGLHGIRGGEADLPDLGFAAPGAEPLTIDAVEFVQLFRGRRTPIKAALLNQSLLSGVGNIYADESLFRAGIRPRRHAGRLKRVEMERLRIALRSVLTEAIALGGSSVSDYVDASGVKGFFQLEHRVYLRTGLPCRECGTAIQRILIGGRGTHFCPQCQR